MLSPAVHAKPPPLPAHEEVDGYDGTVAVLFGKPIETHGVEVEALSATVREGMLGLATGAGAVLAEPG